MWITISGFDRTGVIPFDTINLSQTINDPAPQLTFDVRDDGSLLDFPILSEVVVWNEAAFLVSTTKPSVPSHNLVQLFAVGSGPSGGAWSTTGALSGIISAFPGYFPVVTFSNTTYSGGNNTALLTSVTSPGYIHAGQQYMFSVYVTIPTPLTNALAVIQMQFQDGAGNLLGSPVTSTFASTTFNAQQRVNISATAPTGAYYIQVWVGGQATVSGTNSGTINLGTPQVEPMYFTARGVSYPTPDCNGAQVDCALMPDNTTSRMVRFFSGYIDDRKKEYIGPNRIWHLQCAGSAKILDNGLINEVFTNSLDSDILLSVIATYFLGQISTNAANSSLPDPIVSGVTISSISYSDNTLREVLNGLIGQSGFVFFLDQYYRLYYQPQYTTNPNFALSDSPNNVTSFPYYAYQIEDDGTQIERRIKINGGNFAGNQQDPFSGDGSTKQFNLTYIPDRVTAITVGGVAQRQGVYGVHLFSSGHYDVLLNTQNQYILFNNAPTTGTNNILVTYTYKAPLSTTTLLQVGGIIAPPYTQPTFDSKINDTNITDLATATVRGLTQISQKGSPLTVITCSSQQYAQAGQAIYFTSVPDNLINRALVVQSVTGVMLGKSEIFGVPVNEFQYTLGAYQHSLVDHLRNANKALNRSASTANATAAQQTDFTAMETIGYRDSITATPQSTYAVGVYGTGHYGSCSYGGSTGTYNGSAQYGRSTVYG